MKTENLHSKLASICGIQHLNVKLKPTELFGFDYEFDEELGVENLSDGQKEQIESTLKEELGFNEISWVDSPIFKTEDGVIHNMSTYHIFPHLDYSNFKDKVCHLYKINFTPALWDSETLWKSGNPNGSYVPKFYDNTDGSDDSYQPTRILTVRWNPEEVDADDEFEYVTSIVKDILDNRDEYLPRGRRWAVIRMVVV